MEKQLIDIGYNEETIDDILNKIYLSEYKRRQAPPGIKISNKAFGIGRRYPIVNKYKGLSEKVVILIKAPDQRSIISNYTELFSS